MKRKILSLILVLMLIPFASLFVACGNRGYNLNNLQKDFLAIAEENENLIVDQNKHLRFDYSDHAQLKGVIESNAPYTVILDYNEIYNNMMAFTFDYIGVCSNNKAIEDEETRDHVKQEFDEFKEAIHEVDTYVNILADSIAIEENGDVLAPSCIAILENLLISYETLFIKAGTFNNTLADLYFNRILVNGNPNVFPSGVSEFDINKIVQKFDARLKYQLGNLSQCFVEMYINGAKVPQRLCDPYEDFEFSLDSYGYRDNVAAIKKDFNEPVAFEKASQNKDEYFNLCVEAYNIQAALKNDSSKFIVACKNIEYAGLDASNATGNELMSQKIIEDRLELVKIYNAVLVEMLALTI